MRMVVDCGTRHAPNGVIDDNSSVYNIEMLDPEHKINFSQDQPWIFETDGDLLTFTTEEEACRAQREYRTKMGFDVITGHKL